MRVFSTRITELLGIKHPLVQGGLQWLGTAELAAAVSEAGALGMISARTFPDGPALRGEIRRVRALTSKPFGVNLTISRQRQVDLDGYIDAVLEEGVTVVETAGNNPERYLGRLKAHGVVVLHKCTSVRHARKAADLGADAISVVGYESGGHIGLDEVSMMVLLPRVVEAVPVPVLGTGGADGRGLLAMLALGAEGMLMGTRFVATVECRASPLVKQLIVEASETSTMVLHRSIRNTERALRTPYAERLLDLEQKGATLEEILPLIGGEHSRKAYLEGDTDAGVMSFGQTIGLINEIVPARQVVETIVQQALEQMDRLIALRG